MSRSLFRASHASVLIFLAVRPLAAQSIDFAPVDSTARAEMVRLKAPGAAIAIVQNDRVIYTKAYGVANVETGEPLRPEMLFRLGSTTKMLTAAAVTGLSVQGKLDLNKPLSTYIPTLPPKLGGATANQLLSHTAGVLDRAPMYGPHDESALGAGIAKWTDDWMFTEPGQIFSYSNPGYWVAGYLLEVLARKPYYEAMETQLFRPLGMMRTTLRPFVAMTYPLALGHTIGSDGAAAVARPQADNAESWPAGSVFSNVQELSRFVIAFLNDGKLEGKQVLDPKVIALLSSPHANLPNQTVDKYGYGLTLSFTRGVRMFEHTGSRLGYGSAIRMAPEQRVAVIILTNQTGVNLSATSLKALELMLPLQPRQEPAPKAVLEITKDDLARHVGIFANGDDRIEITADAGKLFIKRDGRTAQLIKRSNERYETEAGSGYVFTTGSDWRTLYITSGSRSLSRIR